MACLHANGNLSFQPLIVRHVRVGGLFRFTRKNVIPNGYSKSYFAARLGKTVL